MRYLTEKEVSTKKGKFAKQNFELSYGQFDSVDEAQNEAGSAQEFLDWLNTQKKTQSINAGRSVIMNAAEDSVLEGETGIISKSQNASKNHKISTRGVGVAAKAADLDLLLAAFKGNDNASLDAILAKYNVKV